MKTFINWYKDAYHEEIPDSDLTPDWFYDKDIPMIVKCTCCESTMCAVSALIDDKGRCYCSSCVG